MVDLQHERVAVGALVVGPQVTLHEAHAIERDALAAQILALLEGAEFGKTPISDQQAQQLIGQAQSLLGSVQNLANNP